VYSLLRLVPEAPTPDRPVVAAFDVDGTLTTSDCVTPFLLRAAGFRLVRALLRHPVALGAAALRRDRDRLKELACSALRGTSGSAIDALGETFAAEIAAKRLREDTVARLRRHRELGHTVILASASLDAYLEPLARTLQVDGVVCTQLERDLDGRLTGRLAGANCRAAEKARRVREWLASAGLSDAALWAYGDSPSDRELLAAADQPVWVGGEQLGAEPQPDSMRTP
jgi:phosphatidylglycerophosphatase C